MITGPNIQLSVKEIEKRFIRVLPRLTVLAGNAGVNFVLDNFKRQGFLGNTFQPWRKRKNPTKWGQVPKRNGRNTLSDTGRLRRSWRYIITGMLDVKIASDDQKARALQEGVNLGIIQNVKAYKRKRFGTQKVGKGVFSIKSKKELTKKVTVQTGEINVSAHKRKIVQRLPPRPMIGPSPYLTASVKRSITAEINRALKM